MNPDIGRRLAEQDALISGLRNAEKRSDAVRQLIRMKDSSALDELVRTLHQAVNDTLDSPSALSVLALADCALILDAIGAIGDRRALDDLVQVWRTVQKSARRDNRDSRERYQLLCGSILSSISTIGPRGHLDARSTILEALNLKHADDVRASACHALGKMAEPMLGFALQGMCKLRNIFHFRVWRAARQSLRTLKEKGHVPESLAEVEMEASELVRRAGGPGA